MVVSLDGHEIWGIGCGAVRGTCCRFVQRTSVGNTEERRGPHNSFVIKLVRGNQRGCDSGLFALGPIVVRSPSKDLEARRDHTSSECYLV